MGKTKGFLGKKSTKRALAVVGPAFMGPFGIPLSAIGNHKWKKEKIQKWEKACECLQEGQLVQAKEMFEVIGREYGWDDLVYEKIMEIHNLMDGKENVVAARNLAIHLIGSDEDTIKSRAAALYESNTEKLLEKGFTEAVVPGNRKYIYIGENAESLGGAYLMDSSKRAVNWFFDLDRVPGDLVFQHGHPQPGLYMSHPLMPNCYYPRKNIEYVLFEEKMLEFIKLVQCLGATRIIFKSKRGMSVSQDKTFDTDIETKVGVKLVGVKADPKGKYAKRAKDNKSLMEERELRLSPKKQIYVPDHLVWYNSDPEWETIVRGRMDRSLEQYDITISTKETSVYSKELDARVKSNFHYLIVGVKGNFAFNEQEVFTQDEETEWSVHVDFAPLDESLVPVEPTPSEPLQEVEQLPRPQETPMLDKGSKEQPKDRDKKKNWIIWVMGGIIVALTIGLIVALV